MLAWQLSVRSDVFGKWAEVVPCGAPGAEGAASRCCSITVPTRAVHGSAGSSCVELLCFSLVCAVMVCVIDIEVLIRVKCLPLQNFKLHYTRFSLIFWINCFTQRALPWALLPSLDSQWHLDKCWGNCIWKLYKENICIQFAQHQSEEMLKGVQDANVSLWNAQESFTTAYKSNLIFHLNPCTSDIFSVDIHSAPVLPSIPAECCCIRLAWQHNLTLQHWDCPGIT